MAASRSTVSSEYTVAGRVAVLRHAPHAPDAGVLAHQPLDHVHVGPVVGHRHRDHLDAEVLADGEVAVVAGHRAEKRDARLLDQGRGLSTCPTAARTRWCRASARGSSCRQITCAGGRARTAAPAARAAPAVPEARRSCGVAAVGGEEVAPAREAPAARSTDRAARTTGLPRVRSSFTPRCCELVVAPPRVVVEGGELGRREPGQRLHQPAIVARGPGWRRM